nr:ATP-binding cassette domain-containing protein [Actinomycetales bacterium]
MLAVSGLSFSYRKGGEELFGGLDYEFALGKTTAVTGASGRGKSTLLYLLGLMLRPSRGRIMMDGRDLSGLADAERARMRATVFGFIFQDASLDPARTILDSVIEPALYAGERRGVARARAGGLLERVGVSFRTDHRPGEISGGQAQRVAVARALVNGPAVILADEPTGNLDHENAGSILDLLGAAAREGCSVIVVTHDPFVVDRCDTVLAL